MTNKVYDLLKYFTQIFLPASATLYASLGSIWNFPFTDEIVGTIIAISTFMSTLLCISSAAYKRKENNNDKSTTDLYSADCKPCEHAQEKVLHICGLTYNCSGDTGE
ncbi:MAG: phage holin [Hominimerdicola sp.]